MGMLYLHDSANIYNPRTLFASGEQGGYYDPSVANTLFQLADGVTAATQPGDPVGLILDSRKGGLSSLGPDLVTNGTFAADSDWTKGANWTIGSGVATKTGGAANNLTQAIASTAGAWYRLTMDVTRTAGTLTVSLGTSGTTYAISASGSYTFLILAGSSTQTLTLAGDSSFAGTVDNVVARNVPGNHLYQPVSGSRGSLSREPDGGKRNLLTRTEEFDNAAWAVNRCNSFGAGSVANATAAPDGTNTADYLQASSATRPQLVRVPLTWAIQTYTFSVYAKQSQTRYLRLIAEVNTAGGSSPDAWFDLQLGASGTTNRCTSAITSAGNGWYRCSITFTLSNTTPVGSSYIIFELANSDGVAGGTISEGLYLWGAALESGSLTSYQKVVSAYDCTEETSVGSGVLKRSVWAIDFDGSDDSYLTSSVDFSASDKMTVWAGVWKRSDAAFGAICELSSSAYTLAGGFWLFANGGASSAGAFFGGALNGSSGYAADFQTYTSPIAAVLCEQLNIAGSTGVDELTMRANGAAATRGNTAGTSAGTGNFGNYPLYVGRRGNSSLPFSGRLYGLIIRGVQTTDAKVREFERYTARLTGKQI